jgi:5-methylcytosine-specific restriction endonuclease McrA
MRHFKTRSRVKIRIGSKLRKHGGTRRPYCGVTMQKGNSRHSPTRDHMIPLCRGGLTTLTNITIICLCCNQEKGALLPDEFVAWRDGRASRIDKGVSWRTRKVLEL